MLFRLVPIIFISLALIVGLKDFPSSGAHEAGGGIFVVTSHLSHAGTGDELEFFFVAARTSEELHSLADSVISSDLEGENLNTLKHGLVVYEELLSVPDIIEGNTGLLWVANTSWVTSSDEVGDAASDARRCVPHDFGGATVVHGGWPDGEDGVFRVKSSVVKESLMLLHALV